MADSKLLVERASSNGIVQRRSWQWIPKLYGCIFIDMSWLDLFYAICSVTSLREYETVTHEVEVLLGGPEKILITLSVRSAFDLFFQAMNFPAESEIITTCINIQPMGKVAESHKVLLKGVDIDLSNLEPDLSQIESLLNEKTVGIMVVQLFGMKFRTSRLKRFAEKHGLVLIVDCAQAFYGPDAIHDVECDFALYSFGSIKRSTCLGGACVVSNNPNMLKKMRMIQKSYPVQGRLEYFLRLAKYAMIIAAVNNPSVAWFLSRILLSIGIDYKVFIKSNLRIYQRPTVFFLDVYRFQPSLPLLLLLKRKMKHQLQTKELYPHSLGRQHAEYAICTLIEEPTYVVGCLSEVRDFWLFPVLVDKPLEVEFELEKMGISAFSKASSLTFNHEPSEKLKSSQFICKHILYLPIDRRTPKWHIDNVCKSFIKVLQNRKSIFEIAEKEGVPLKRNIETFLQYSSIQSDDFFS